jgi:hypothetical protein
MVLQFLLELWQVLIQLHRCTGSNAVSELSFILILKDISLNL